MSAAEWIEAKRRELTDADQDLDKIYQRFVNFYRQKLWHQLTLELESAFSTERFQRTDLYELYTRFIRDFESKLNELRLAQLVLIIARQFKDRTQAIAFLQSIEEKVKDNKEAKLLLWCSATALKLLNGDILEAKKVLEEAKQLLESLSGAEGVVIASYYSLALQYHRTRTNAGEFYRSALQYLAYAPPNSISPAEQHSLAFELCLAALVADDVHGFGELLGHSVLKSLEGTEDQWVAELVRAFNFGNIAEFRRLAEQYQAKVQAQPYLVKNTQHLNEKIAVLALMQLIFERSPENRIISFHDIATHTQVSVDQVEVLVIKALSLKLVRGAIDQVARTVSFTWVQPRVLDLTQIASLGQRIREWQEKVDRTILFVEGQSPELVHQQ